MTKTPWDLEPKELPIKHSVLKYLNQLYRREPTAEEIGIDALLPNANDMLEAEVNRRRKRGLIVEALKAHDGPRAVCIAGSDQALRDLIAGYHHGRGREKGEARSSDLPDYVKDMRAELAVDTQLILKQFSITKRFAQTLAITHRFNLNLTDPTDADKKLITYWLRKLNSKSSNAARDRRRSS
jgi:hypothetical protein